MFKIDRGKTLQLLVDRVERVDGGGGWGWRILKTI